MVVVEEEALPYQYDVGEDGQGVGNLSGFEERCDEEKVEVACEETD